jgi:hypothetical protein
MVRIQSAEMCLSYVAEHRNNESICELISSTEMPNEKLLCLAHVTNDPSYCDQMKDPFDQAGAAPRSPEYSEKLLLFHTYRIYEAI